MKNDFSLYVIFDPDYLSSKNKNWKKALFAVLKGGATAVQLRSKKLNDRNFYSLALEVKKIIKPYKAAFIVNDRVQLAARCNADGVHIGADDMSYAETKKIMKKKIVGVSASDMKEALANDRLGASYIGLGPVFKTAQKNTEPISAAALKKIMKKIHTPVVAIGGINEYNIPELKKCGIKNFSIISAILGADNIRKKTEQLKSLIG